MVKASSHYVCQSCGTASPKWAGKCEACGGWNTFVEETLVAVPGVPRLRGRAARLDFVGLEGESKPVPRRQSGMGEFDRVTGGGLVPGSVLLVGGDPGIGKSTLLLQIAARLAGEAKVAYITGEESVDQIRLRASRLNLATAPLQLAAATAVGEITGALEAARPDLVIIDSIQTMFVEALDSAPGTVAQVRASAHELIRFAKKRGCIVVLVGHVTKEGTIAGPRVLEHMVDAVLYFEGERGHHFRILRTVKNRYGPTDEIGVFEMTDGGLSEVANPSALFLTQRQRDAAGAVVFAGMEGTRPLLIEIQALVSPSALGTPRRAVVGWDSARLAMVLAVLEARCGVTFGMNDVYLSIAGGLRINEPAADLAVAAALVSALTNTPVPGDAVFFGEIGLTGEVRAVAQPEARLKEAAKLGFATAFMPKPPKGRAMPTGLNLTAIETLAGLLPLFADTPRAVRSKAG